ncbi:unnamed protein product, partial [Prorocentrum cordatum]
TARRRPRRGPAAGAGRDRRCSGHVSAGRVGGDEHSQCWRRCAGSSGGVHAGNASAAAASRSASAATAGAGIPAAPQP